VVTEGATEADVVRLGIDIVFLGRVEALEDIEECCFDCREVICGSLEKTVGALAVVVA